LIYNLAIVSSSFKDYLNKYIKLYNKEEKSLILSKALNIFSKLDITSLKESLDLINLYSNSLKGLKAFKELKVRDLFIYNFDSNCLVILSNKYSIKRYIRENYNSSSSNITINTSSYKVIKG
jgi:hypothetical protein